MHLLLRIGPLLGALATVGSAQANPVYPDEESFQRGADVYAIHCADCHGWSILDTFERRGAEEDEYSYIPEIDYDALVNEVHGIEEVDPDELVFAEEEEEEWPEWAEFPDPAADDRERLERQRMIDQVSAAIDAVYNAESDALDVEEAADALADPEEIDAYGPVDGATELENPYVFSFGTTDEDIFVSIAEGNGENMPAFRDSLNSEEEIWDLVNFIRSFWPDEEAEY